MSTRITVMYDVPKHPDVFEVAYDAQMALAAALPRLQRVEAHRVWPTSQVNPRLAYRVVELHFEGTDALREAMGTQQARSLFPSIFELGACGVQIAYHAGW
jgi:hypothetical protein